MPPFVYMGDRWNFTDTFGAYEELADRVYRQLAELLHAIYTLCIHQRACDAVPRPTAALSCVWLTSLLHV